MWEDVNWSRMCLKGQSKEDENGPGCTFEVSPNLSPYDHNSIMHYSGAAGGCGQVMTYKGTSSTHIGNLGNFQTLNKLTTQDLLQINWIYKCPLQKTFPCKTWRYKAESVFLGRFRNLEIC